ncbi:MAG: DUF4870 domain-containing protein [Myxococcota bacterium]
MSYSLTRPDTQSRNLAVIAHLAAYSGLILPALAPIIIPIVVLAIKPHDEYVREHALESLNLEITLWLAIAFFGLLSFLLIGLPFLLVTILFGLIAPIPAAIAAATGEPHRYSFIIRFFN